LSADLFLDRRSGVLMPSDFPHARSYELISELKMTRKMLAAVNPDKTGVDVERHKESLLRKIGNLEAEIAAREPAAKAQT
jgi:hypothetical protein